MLKHGLGNILRLRKKEAPNASLSDKDYSSLAIEQMVKVLLDQTLRDHHQIVLNGIKYIVQNLGTECVQYLHLVIPPLLKLIKYSEHSHLNESLYHCLFVIINTVKEQIGTFCDDMFDTMHEIFMEKEHQGHLLDLLKLIGHHASSKLKEEMYLLVPKLLNIIETNKLSQTGNLTSQCLKTIAEVKPELLDDYLYLLIPSILGVCASGQTALGLELKICALGIFYTLVNCENFKEHMAQILHSLLGVMETTPALEYVRAIVTVFKEMAVNAGVDFAPYLPLIQKAMRRIKVADEEYDELVERILCQNQIEFFIESLERVENRDKSNQQSQSKDGGSSQ